MKFIIQRTLNSDIDPYLEKLQKFEIESASVPIYSNHFIIELNSLEELVDLSETTKQDLVFHVKANGDGLEREEYERLGVVGDIEIYDDWRE